MAVAGPKAVTAQADVITPATVAPDTLAGPALAREAAAGRAAPGSRPSQAAGGPPSARRLPPSRVPAVISSRPVLPQAVRAELARPGQRLDNSVRARMEQLFGEDLGQVRVHADGPAAWSARAIKARAYTVGEHVVFASGRFAPNTAAGHQLLAHELTHVIQQRDVNGGGPPPGHPALEREAALTPATAVTGAGSVGLALAADTGVATPEDIEAYQRLRELQEQADTRASTLMEGVIRKRLALWDAAQERAAQELPAKESPAPALAPAAPAKTHEERRQEMEGLYRGDLVVAVGYAVDEKGQLHQLVTTSKGRHRKLVDRGPDESWVKAVRRRKGDPIPPIPPAPPAGQLAAQHQGGEPDAEPQRRRTAEEAFRDAEARLVSHAARYKLRLLAVGASSDICPHCASKLGLVGSTTASPRAKDPLRENVSANVTPSLEAIKNLPPGPARRDPVVQRLPAAPARPATPARPAAPASPAAPAKQAAAGSAALQADSADTEVLQHAQMTSAPVPTPPPAPTSAPPPAATPAPAPTPKVTVQTTGDLEKVTRTRVTDASTDTSKQVTTSTTTAGLGGVSGRTERLESREGTGTKTGASAGVGRGSGSLLVSRGRDESRGTFDQEGRLVSGTQASSTASGGLIAGPQGMGAAGSASVQHATVYGNSFSTRRSIGGHAQVVVSAKRMPDSDPPQFQMVVTITVAATAQAGAGLGQRATGSASVSLSGAVTGSFVHVFSVADTTRYLGVLDRGGAGEVSGAEQELRVVQLVSKGSVDEARQLLTTLASAVSAKNAAALAPGEQATVAVEGSAAGSLGVGSGGKAPVGLTVSFSKSKSLRRTVARQDDAVLITVEVVAGTGGEVGASGSYGAVGGGLSYAKSTSAGRMVTFRLNPKDSDYQATFDRVLAADTADQLTALAAAEPGRVQGTGTSRGWSTTVTPSVSVAGADVSIATTHAYMEKVTRDAAGTRKEFAGSSGGGVDVGITHGPKLSYRTEQSVAAAVGPGGTASGDVSTTTSQTDFGASVRALGQTVEKSPIAGLLGIATGGTSLLQASTDVAGMKLSDADFAAISAVSHDRGRWEHAFRGRVNQSLMAWRALGRQIAASGGDRETMSRAMAEYASANDQASDAIQAVVRPRGQGEGGIRYEWPGTLASEQAAFESIVVGDRLSRYQAQAASGAFEPALAGLTADNARLGKVAKAIVATADQFSDSAAVAEMLRRIGDAQTAMRAEIRKLRAALGPAKPGPGTPQEVSQGAPAQADDQARQERNAKIDTLIPALLTLRDKENAIFAEVRAELDHPPWYRGSDVIGVILKLTTLDPLYARWDELVSQLRAVFQERGEDGSRADHYGPDRKTLQELRHHPKLAN
jgi:hypothetical protein